jgi:PKHD-type hydroxylase
MGPVRTDFTAVLALSDPDDYEGGDHHVVDPLLGEMVIRPAKGELMIYETGYPHWVTNVTKGTRISALTWIESLIPDERKRGLMKTARLLSREMESRIDYEDDDCPFRQWFVDIGVVHSGLHRMWAKK